MQSALILLLITCVLMIAISIAFLLLDIREKSKLLPIFIYATTAVTFICTVICMIRYVLIR